MNILILEPDSGLRQHFRQWVKDTQHEVIDVGDGWKALEVIERESVQVVLADFHMPGFGGSDLVSEILASDLAAYPYIIFMIDELDQQQAVDCLGPIPGDYLIKPLAQQDLLARLSIAERALALQTRFQDAFQENEPLALYDQLTGVLNRQAIYQRALAEVNRAQRDGGPISLVMVEIADLADILQQYGRQVSDQALQFVARVIRANVRIYDLVGRWIGSKFLLLLPGADLGNAIKVFERIHQSVSVVRIRLPEDDHLQLDVVAGVTHLPAGEQVPIYELIEQANQALAAAAQDSDQIISSYSPD